MAFVTKQAQSKQFKIGGGGWGGEGGMHAYLRLLKGGSMSFLSAADNLRRADSYV